MPKEQVRPGLFPDLTDMFKGFRDNNMYRLEQPRLPEDIHARLRSRQYRASSNSTGFSPVQRRSPGRMLLSPARSTRTDFASIFVGGLPATATQEELRHMFQIYGQILNIDIVHKASVNSKFSSPVHSSHERSLIIRRKRGQYVRLY